MLGIEAIVRDYELAVVRKYQDPNAYDINLTTMRVA